MVAQVGPVDWNPPSALRYPERPQITLDRGLLARSCRDEAAVCFTVEGATAGQTRSVPQPNGGLSIETRLDGVVTFVGEEHLMITDGPETRRVRYLLPSAVNLENILGSHVNVSITLRFSATKSPTVDALIADCDGQPLLWALDGALPEDREGRPVVRTTHEANARRLVFSQNRGVATVATADTAPLETATGPATVAGIRIGQENVGFLVIWA